MPTTLNIFTWLGGGLRLPLLVGVVLLAVYGLVFADAYGQQLLTIAGCYAIMVLGYQFVFGHAGALSLAQGAFFGLGAYVTGILGSQLGWSFPLTFPLSVALPVVLAAAIALPVLRLESHYFALATLAVGQIVWLVAINWEAVTGGANGLPGVPGVQAFGFAVPKGTPMLVLVWGLFAAALVLAARVTGGLAGRRLEVLREDPLLAGTLGINTGRRRFEALLLSAGCGGAAGALFVHTIGVISPESTAFPVMVAALTMAVVGGRLHPAGAVVGALVLVHIPEWARPVADWRLVLYGAAMLAMIIAAPEGLLGLAATARRRLFPEPAPALPAPTPIPPRRQPETDGPLLRASGLGKRFGGIIALGHVDVTLDRGEVLGLIGPNGSGKTTLVNLLTGVERPDAGEIILAGHTIVGTPPWAISRAGIARSFQTCRLPPGMRVLDAVAAARARTPAGDARTAYGAAMSLLDRCGLAERAMTPCARLGPAERRRLELARALALDPTVLVLDEPAAGLDADAQQTLAALIRALAGEGLGVLVVEHDLGFLMPLADRMICLDAGRVVAEGEPAALRGHAAIRAAYFGAPIAEPGP